MTIRRRFPFFYGWIAVGGGMMVTIVSGGAFMSSFGVFLPVISADFGWSRGTVAGAIALGTVAFGLPSPFFGAMINKLGARRAIVLGNFLSAVGMAGLFLVHQVWQYYLLYIFIGATGGLGGYIACSTIGNNWFVSHLDDVNPVGAFFKNIPHF